MLCVAYATALVVTAAAVAIAVTRLDQLDLFHVFVHGRLLRPKICLHCLRRIIVSRLNSVLGHATSRRLHPHHIHGRSFAYVYTE